MWATCLSVVVSWIAIGSAWSILPKYPPFRRMNAGQLDVIRYVLSVTSPRDAVFDADSVYIFRPQASYYGSLMRVTRIRIRRGELEFDIPERCERLACKVVIMSTHIAYLPREVHAWIRDNYIPSPTFPQVLLHKSLVSESAGSAGQR